MIENSKSIDMYQNPWYAKLKILCYALQSLDFKTALHSAFYFN